MEIIDDGSRARQTQIAPVVVDTFHLTFASLRDGQALIDICREGPAGHSQSPGLALDVVGGRSPNLAFSKLSNRARLSLCSAN